ncbi:polysaccharide deacetylase family protein [Alicyclobacillus sp. SP_1]|uniref:polysaccharide deacetylase family protein n=1 Tax=Alicyclobacillus sp. SP_1 TaxID=2942475 RepID=UPI0021584C0F|nr:polysaccharide deacetylase family protein [Alicyclobacillus sp. SP_1]
MNCLTRIINVVGRCRKGSITLQVSVLCKPLVAMTVVLLFLCFAVSSVQAAPRIWLSVPTETKEIALTFDDGPSATFTPQVLKLLRKYHAHATFFVIGNRIVPMRTLILDELRQGHEIANHTYHHVVLRGLGAESIARELELPKDAMEKVAGEGRIAPWFRPPRGHMDKVVIKVARLHGYRIVLWSVDSRDWENPPVSRLIQRVLKHTKPGAILLFHDQGGDRTVTIQALYRLLPSLEAEGYSFVTVSQLVHDSTSLE